MKKSQNNVWKPYSIIHERCSKTCSSKRYDYIFIVIRSVEGFLRDVTICNSLLVIDRFEVYITKATRDTKYVEQVIDPWDGILILDCGFVQLFIVNPHFERLVFLFCEQNYITLWRDTGSEKVFIWSSFNYSFNYLTSSGSIL